MGKIMKRTARTILVGIVAPLTALALTALALAAPAIAAPGRIPASICSTHEQSVQVTSYGVTYNVTTGNYGGHHECIALYGNRPAFKVTSSFWVPKVGGVQGYPSVGTAKSTLPKRIWALGNTAKVTWSYATNHAPGAWNASIETWISTKPKVIGHPDGAEMMIWLNKTPNIAKTVPKRIVHIAGTAWYLASWRTGSSIKWNYVQFRRVHPITHVKALPLAPFFWAAEKAGLLSNQWYLQSVGAGFEIWNGGRGLSTSWFRATV